MVLRNWLIRGLILTGLAALVAFGWQASSWISPERVREKVIATLSEHLDGVDVYVGSARLRIWGGIEVKDIKLVRHGDRTDQPFLSVESAILYHDKEQLNHGRLLIKNVELVNPVLSLERNAEGQWNLSGVVRSGPADSKIPTFVAKGATVKVTDKVPGGYPDLNLTDVRFSLLNDPLPVLNVEGRAQAQGFGPVQMRGRLNRITGQMNVGLELFELPLGEIAVAVAKDYPDIAPHLSKLSAKASVRADLIFTPNAVPAWRHDIHVEVKDGRYEHADLPWPAEKILVKARCVDGRVRIEEASAQLGPVKLALSLETRTEFASDPAPRTVPTDSQSEEKPDFLKRLEPWLQRLEVSATGLPLDDTVFKHLSAKALRGRRMFAPSGAVDVSYKFGREAAGWKREVELRPQRMAIRYEKFPYPVADLRGWLKGTSTHAGADDILVDLIGTAGGQLITIKGQINGDGPDPAINLRIAGTNVPIDEHLITALPGRYPDLVRQFHPSGRGDFVAEIVQEQRINLCKNEFRLDVRDGTVNYVQFPYPFEKVKGCLLIRVAASDPTRHLDGTPIRDGEAIVPKPDQDEFLLDRFTAVHGGSTISLHGSKKPIPGTPDRKLTLHVGGHECEVDANLRTALAGLKLDPIWSSFSPHGKLTFDADVEILDRAGQPGRLARDLGFDPAADLKLNLRFYGPTVTPSFFPYDLTSLSGGLEYQNGHVDLKHVSGLHGDSRVKLDIGSVQFYPEGVVFADLRGLEIKPLQVDAALLKALPASIRGGLESLKLKGGMELMVQQLVVRTPPDGAAGEAPPPPQGTPIASTKPPTGVAGAQNTILPAAYPVPGSSVVVPDPIVYWNLELKLAGASLDTGVTWEGLNGALACRGRYEGTHLGLVRGNIWLEHAVVSGQPVDGAKARVLTEPQRPDPARPGQFLPVALEFKDVAGGLFHGTLGGEAQVVLAEPVRYDLWLTATDVQLDEVAKHYKLGNDSDLTGAAQAQLRLINRPDPRTGQLIVEGVGRIDVPTGRMYKLPVLLDLVKMLKGLQAPDKTAFEEAHAAFRILGDRVKVEQLDLIGKAVCLGGSGEVDTTGEYVKFEFYTIWSQVLKQMINTPVGDFSAFMSRNLFKIKMTRENGELRYKPEPIPIVTEPIKGMIERMKTGTERLMGR